MAISNSLSVSASQSGAITVVEVFKLDGSTHLTQKLTIEEHQVDFVIESIRKCRNAFIEERNTISVAE